MNVFQPDAVGDGNRLGDVADGAGSVCVTPAVALGGTAVPVGVPVAVPLVVPFVVPLADALGGVAVADPVSGGAAGGPQAARSIATQAPAAVAAPERAGPDDP
ncbi:hypothetical protein [Arthrobacter sp. Y81]|uniref:hypothetical protein n=1 Tax=Arthrobacter sp. Y81 TaxID=2058897 RepID=UPI0021575BA3|nr:hypothetical protein [Arthrobacter sp. Y81]